MLEGFAYCKMLYDIEEHPVDFIYITVNPAFDRILGTTAIAGKLVTEVFPGIKENFPSMFEIYGRVALKGEPESFDLDFQPSKKWLHISVYSPAKGYFVAVFYDITERKLAEETLRNLTRELEFRVLQRTAELELEIVHRKAAEETITASLNEKEILLREIHHRVKNNLQIITSLIRLHYRQITDPGTIHALQDSESRIRSMALVHEKLYHSTDLANIDFTDYIRSLTTSLITAYATDPHRIRLVIDVKDVSLDINRAIPVGLIMNELVANALKHAFPEGMSGKITITGRRTPAGITLSVQDNGVGLPEGLDWRNTTTLGLHLIITLIRQVNGSIELNCNGGTAFEMFIPSVIKETSS
jgi:two-component sensor histidine kinase